MSRAVCLFLKELEMSRIVGYASFATEQFFAPLSFLPCPGLYAKLNTLVIKLKLCLSRIEFHT